MMKEINLFKMAEDESVRLMTVCDVNEQVLLIDDAVKLALDYHKEILSEESKLMLDRINYAIEQGLRNGTNRCVYNLRMIAFDLTEQIKDID